MTTTRAGVGRRGVQLPPSSAAATEVAAAAAAEVGKSTQSSKGGIEWKEG